MGVCTYKTLIRDFPQTKLDSEINSPFLLNKHGYPDFFKAFAKNSLMKNMFERKKKSLTVEHDFILENSPLLDVFWPRPGLQANHGTVQKSACNIATTKQSKTAYMKQ